MSDFSRKVLDGKTTTDMDWNEHLVEAHRRSPSQTPKAFGAYKTSQGQTTYERLAFLIDKLLPKPRVIVDLACGDGFLVPTLLGSIGANGRVYGIDMSEAELDVAKRRVHSDQVTFIHEKAQQLSLSGSSVDLVLCHMAFMLMTPVEPVISEIARVLRPNGHFAAVIGNKNRSKGLYAVLGSEIQSFIEAEFPKIASARMGDPRVRTKAGLSDLFSPRLGFSDDIQIEEFELNIETTPEGLWSFFRDMYHVVMLPETLKKTLKERLTSVATNAADRAGRVFFEFPMCQILVRKK